MYLVKGVTSLPDSCRFVTILKDCARQKDVETGRKIQAQVAQNGLERDVFVGSTLVSMFGKCGLFSEARKVFNKLPVRNEVSWNALITAYVDCGCSKEALKCFEQMHLDACVPNVVTYMSCLKACSIIGAIERGRKLHADIVKKGLEVSTLLGNTLVDFFVKCGSLMEAQEVFEMLPGRDTVSWNALLAGYADYRHGEEALSCFEMMQHAGILPDPVTFVCVLKACGYLGDIDRGRQVRTEIIKKGLETNIYVASTLVNIFSKCGLLPDAKDAFERMSFKNVVSWNAMIAGYTQFGCDKEALDCFEQMHLEGRLPNAVTFVCSLKACGSLGALERGRQISVEIAEQGLVRDCFVGSTLVNMFVDCGSLDEAQEVFDTLLMQDAVSWSALIGGYTEHGLCTKALESFEHMNEEGTSPVAVTFVCSLKACGSLGAIEKGRGLCTEITMKGYEKDPFVGNTLVDMLAKCGYFDEAQNLFDRLPTRDVVSWSALITGLAEHGHGEEALNLFKDMKQAGIPRDVVTFASILKACGISRAEEIGREVHSEIAKTGLESDMLVGNAVLDMLIKLGLLGEAREVFDKLPTKDVVTWSVLVTGFEENGLPDEALRCFEQMRQTGVSPDAIAVICSLQASSSTHALDKGQGTHVELVKVGLDRDVVVGNALIGMYARCGSYVEARGVLCKLFDRDVVSWNTLIAGYAEQGFDSEALSCYHKMQLEGVAPDGVTYVCSLEACSSTGAIDKGLQIYGNATQAGLEKDSVVGSTLVTMFAKCGALEEAELVFGKLVYRDIVSWSALITGYAEHRLGEQALDCLDRMQRQGVCPDVAMLILGLKACSVVGFIENGQRLHAESLKKGLENNPSLGSMVVDMYCKCGSLADAQAVFNGLPGRDVASWTSMIKGFGMNHEGELSLQFFENMQHDGIKPDGIAFICLLTACSHVSLVSNGQKYFQLMRKVHEIEPVVDHYACVVDLLARSGHVSEAFKFIETMECAPSMQIFNSLLSACGIYGELELGTKCFQQLIEMSPAAAPAYVMMASSLASTSRWEDAMRIEKLRKLVGAKKKPATALIEVGKKIYEFVIGHNHSNDNVPMVVKLSSRSRSNGYVPSLDLVTRRISEQEEP